MHPQLSRLPYGLQGGVLKHISDVPRGLACCCSCPSCGKPLVAKKGALQEHHFAHQSDTSCASALETALHLAAKQILAARRTIRLPSIVVKYDGGKPDDLMRSEQDYSLDEVLTEQRSGKIVPDLIAVVNGEPLVIEIRVTHAVDAAKLEKIRAQNLSTVEIDLSTAPRSFSPAGLEVLVVDSVLNKIWLHSTVAETARMAAFARARPLPAIRRGFALHVDHCPIYARSWKGRPYANVNDDCVWCKHSLEFGEELGVVLCDGVDRSTQQNLF